MIIKVNKYFISFNPPDNYSWNFLNVNQNYFKSVRDYINFNYIKCFVTGKNTIDLKHIFDYRERKILRKKYNLYLICG